jgi:hypothetical protein
VVPGGFRFRRRRRGFPFAVGGRRVGSVFLLPRFPVGSRSSVRALSCPPWFPGVRAFCSSRGFWFPVSVFGAAGRRCSGRLSAAGRRKPPLPQKQKQRKENKTMTLQQQINDLQEIINENNAKMKDLQQKQRDEEHKAQLERAKAFKAAYPKADYFEIDGRVYMSYSIWRRHIAPFRAKLPHKKYYPTLAEFAEYQVLASEDGYAYYGYHNTRIDLPLQWINMLNDLRAQAGKKYLDYHEEHESLDKGFMVCYN